GEPVEHAPLHRAFEERVVGVLAVDVGDPGTELAQGRRWHRHGLDPRTRAARALDVAAQKDRVALGLNAVRLEPGTRLRRWRQGAFERHFGPFGSLANHL